MIKKSKFLSLVLIVMLMFSTTQGMWASAAEVPIEISTSDASISGINHKTNTCDAERESAVAQITPIADGAETVHQYSVTKTATNIQELYRIDGVGGSVHVASYDIRFDEIYLDEKTKDNETVVAFRGFDDSGSGSGKDYNPYIEAVKATKNGDSAATLATVAGDELSYNTWYTFYMVSRIDGANRYSSLYYRERDNNSPTRYINETSDAYTRDGVLSYVYVYVLSTKFDAEKPSVFCVDNISYRQQQMIFAQTNPVADVYSNSETASFDVYLAPGFASANICIDDASVKIPHSVYGIYNVRIPMASLSEGEHNFKMTATYGEGDSQNILTYEKNFTISNKKTIVSISNETLADGISYNGESAPFLAVPAGAEQTDDGTATKIALSDTVASGTEYIKIPFYSSGTSYYNVASTGKSHAISFDMKISGVVATSSSADLMQVRGLKNGAWTGGTYKLTVSKENDTTVIKGLGTDYEIDQDKWYTYTFVTNPSASTYNVYIRETGSIDAFFAGTVNDADTASINCIALGLLKGSCKIQAGSDTQSRIAPDIYIDNLCIREAFKVYGRNISDKVYTTGDTFNSEMYLAPGFDSATVTFGDEVVSINNNAGEVYTISKKLSDCDAPAEYAYIVTANYGDNSISFEESVKIVAKSAYTVHKDTSGNDMYYTLDNAATTDGAFPCMTVEQEIASYSLDTGKGGTGKSLKATFTGVGNGNAYCNFGYLGGNAATIANDRYTRISMDVKFSTREFRLKAQNKFNNAWLSAGNSKEFINKYGIVQIEDKNTFYYDTNRWYNVAYVIDTVNSKGDFYLDGEYIGTNTLALGDVENPTQLQFCIAHKSATADNPAYLWADNLKVETSPYYFYGIEGEEFAEASDDADEIAVNLVSNPGSGVEATAEFSDGTSAGDVALDVINCKAALLTDTAFNPLRDITINIKDASDGKVLAKQTYTFVGADDVAINDAVVKKDGDSIKAIVYARGADATLVLAAYTGTEVKKLSAVDMKKITPTDTRTSFDLTLPAESGDYFAAFVWDNEKVEPLKLDSYLTK